MTGCLKKLKEHCSEYQCHNNKYRPDLTVYKDNGSELENRLFFEDRIYQNRDFFKLENKGFNSEMLTPVKCPKGVADQIKKFDKAAGTLFQGDL